MVSEIEKCVWQCLYEEIHVCNSIPKFEMIVRTVNSKAVLARAGSLIITDSHLTTQQLVQIHSISLGSVHMILHNHLHVSHVCAHWAPCLLMPEQKQWHVEGYEYWSKCVHVEYDEW